MNLPALLSDSRSGLTKRQERTLAVEQRQHDLSVERHSQQIHANLVRRQQDMTAVRLAAQYALDSELDLLRYGIDRSQGQRSAIELVARRVDFLSRTNDQILGSVLGGQR